MRGDLLSTIQTFLSETGMGQSYFGKVSCGNSEVVSRLQNGGRIWPDTEEKIRAFMLSELRRRKSEASAA